MTAHPTFILFKPLGFTTASHSSNVNDDLQHVKTSMFIHTSGFLENETVLPTLTTPGGPLVLLQLTSF